MAFARQFRHTQYAWNVRLDRLHPRHNAVAATSAGSLSQGNAVHIQSSQPARSLIAGRVTS